MIWDSILKSGMNMRKELTGNIILAGGNTMYRGFHERLKEELLELISGDLKAWVRTSADPKCAAWKGASVCSSLSTFASSWMTRDDYYEHGASIVHGKVPNITR